MAKKKLPPKKPKPVPKRASKPTPKAKPKTTKPAKTPAKVKAKPKLALVGTGQAHRDQEAARRRAASSKVREIGPLPEVLDPDRKERGRQSLEAFCREYFPNRFRLAFSSSHRVAIERMERCTDGGGLFACAMPRGSGKTTIAEVAVLRAVLYGLRRFVVLVCATGTLAKRRLKQLQRELERNDLLLEDFPEACYPIRCLNRIHNRAAGQTINDQPTYIELTAESIILPTVAASKSAGAVLQVASMEGAIRGANVSSPDGEPMRPDMAVVDDAQTRESAKSLQMTTDREQVVSSDVLGLAGPDVTIAAVMLCTVIYPADLSDRFLSHDGHPEWQGVRTAMLEAFPADMALWDKYDEVRRESFRSGDGGRRANEFYSANRDAMDKGARVSWPERKKPGELSGIQSAMNLYYADRKGFLAEYQNAPEPEGGKAHAKELLPDQVADRLSGVARMTVPTEAVRVTCGIDPGTHLLWYCVVAWDQHFGGHVIDYGSWPRQNRSVYEAADPRPGLADRYPGSEEQRVYAGLTDLTADVLGRPYYRQAGGDVRVERCLTDSGWLTDTVYQCLRASPHVGVLYPSKGIGRTTTSRGVSEWAPRPGEQSGSHWRVTTGEKGKGRQVQFDPDAWKSFLWGRLTTAPGGRGYLGLFGSVKSDHELFANHLAAETALPVTIRGSTFDKWEVRVHKPDNHFWDTLVLAAVAASVQGSVFTASSAPAPPRPAPVKASDLYAQARAREAAKQGGRR